MKKEILFTLLISLALVGCQPASKSSSGSSASLGTTKIEIFSSNDLHGQIEKQPGRCGILEYAQFFMERGKKANTLLIDQGDSWQGSIYSNHNHGAMVSEIMSYIGVDARTVGNHDFDWGTEYLISNTALQPYNKVYNLAGNVYSFNFNTKEVGDEQLSIMGDKHAIFTLENGLKVGVLGGIGKNQITSICSLYTQDLTFTDHIEYIKSESQILKDEGCDVIIAAMHTGQEELLGYDLSDYVDLVLCGHTHREERTTENGLLFVQSRAYTQSFAHITLTYDLDKKDVTKSKVEFISNDDVSYSVNTIDPNLREIYNKYYQPCNEEAVQVVANNVSGYFDMENQAPNMMAKAIYEQAIEEGYDDICLTYVNVARNSLSSDMWTYANVYQSFPFDNEVVIAEIKGSEFLYEICNYNYIFRNPSFTANEIEPNGTYKIAILDFLYYHTNVNRYYDYFSRTGGTSTTYLSKNYREILRDYLIENYSNGEQLSASAFDSSLPQHNRTVFYSA